MKVVFFTKDRMLQFEGFLESFLFATGFPKRKITVMLPSPKGYEKIIEKNSEINWYYDNDNFNINFRVMINMLDDKDKVLFGCDDQVYTRFVNLYTIEDYMDNNPDCLGFSLRLGTNIQGIPPQTGSHDVLDKLFYEWNWRSSSGHWSWVLELMATVYRGSLLKEIINAEKDIIKCPNFYESFGVQYCWKHAKQPSMTMYNTPNYTVAQDVNRVQNFFENKFTGTDNESPENLKKLYKDGKRLMWENLWGIIPDDCFVQNKYWKVI